MKRMNVVRGMILITASMVCADCIDSGVPPEPLIPPCDALIGRWQSLGLESETVTAIALHPTDPRVIYAGTQINFSDGVQGKLFKSTNCGTTWDTLMVGGSYLAIALDPTNPEIVYAVPGSIRKSYDAGRTWQTIMNGIEPRLDTRVQSLAIDPHNPNVLYAGLGGFFGGPLYKSIDAGANWQNISGADPYLGSGIISIAIDPNNSNTVLVGTAGPGVVLRSKNAGATWNLTGLGETNQLINDIHIDTHDSRVVLAGFSFIGIMKSQDGGLSWRAFTDGLPDSANCMRFSLGIPLTTLFVIVTKDDKGGVYRRDGHDLSWRKIGIEEVRRSYYYSDLKFTSIGKALYFGTTGLYRMRLE